MTDRKRPYGLGALALVALVALALLGAAGDAGARGKPTHLDKHKVRGGCYACHRGRGAAGTPLLKTKLGDICFECHGSDRQYGMAPDIESELMKRSGHPIRETWRSHSVGEVLPEEDPLAVRHASCFDCHQVHVSTEEESWKGIPGYDPFYSRQVSVAGPPPGRKYLEAKELYQVCYNCHSDSANLPVGATNKAEEFDTENPSYHPIELPGQNKSMPSLTRDYTVNSTLTCGSCHGNDDPRGAKGPHGSRFDFLLKERYRIDDGIPEGPTAYQLCYSCHDRRSILGDESFRRHRVHIVSERTSCRSCHNSHGSATYEHLIDFPEATVAASAKSGGPTYTTGSSGRPKCYLSCHGVDHNAADVGGRDWPW
jgi:predicted CXXCH cytochrome family protein